MLPAGGGGRLVAGVEISLMGFRPMRSADNSDEAMVVQARLWLDSSDRIQMLLENRVPILLGRVDERDAWSLTA